MECFLDVMDMESSDPVEDCPDDLEGIMDLVGALHDGSGVSRYTDDFGAASDDEIDGLGSPGALLMTFDWAF